LTWAELEPRVRALEQGIAPGDPHRRIVRVALRRPPAQELYLGVMSNAPIARGKEDAVQWSDGSWQPI